MPNVGYGTNKKDRHVLPNGFKKVSTAWRSTPGGRGPTQHGGGCVCSRGELTHGLGELYSKGGLLHTKGRGVTAWISCNTARQAVHC